MPRWRSSASVGAATETASAGAIGATAAQADGTLDHIKDSAEIRLAYRADASPFSYEIDGKPSGYSVNLCLEVAKRLKEDLNLPKLTVSFVKVTAAGVQESHPHDIQITKEAPNYRVETT